MKFKISNNFKNVIEIKLKPCEIYTIQTKNNLKQPEKKLEKSPK